MDDLNSLPEVQAELARVKRELDSFTYSISHDLRAPVRAILGFTESAVSQVDEKKNPDLKSDLQRVLNAGRRMNRLIEGLLELSRIARADFRKESIDLSTMSKDIIDGLKKTDPARKVEIQIQKELSVNADRKLFSLMVRHLLENAWKFTSKKSSATIEVGMKPGTPTVYFVKDDGIGFGEANKEKLFGVFQRLNSEDSFPGIGIGLAIADRIVHRHGGKIWAEGALDAGATFFFTLP